MAAKLICDQCGTEYREVAPGGIKNVPVEIRAWLASGVFEFCSVTCAIIWLAGKLTK